MKQELLEYIIRACAKEVLTQLNEEKQINEGLFNSHGRPSPFLGAGFIKEEEDTKGAPAPPAAGQGTADQPPIPKDEKPADTEPEKPKTPDAPPAPELKGIVMVSPRDKSKLQKIDLKAGDDASLERGLHRIAANAAGSRVKTALSTMRMVKDTVRNPNTSVYLYIGKYDPQSDELFLMADKSLQVAKDSSVPPTEFSSGMSSIAPGTFNPSVASDTEFAHHLSNQGQVPVEEPVDENLKSMIKKMVNELLDSK